MIFLRILFGSVPIIIIIIDPCPIAPFHATINCKDGNYPGGVLVIYKQVVVVTDSR
jgi:hypothetical protein